MRNEESKKKKSLLNALGFALEKGIVKKEKKDSRKKNLKRKNLT